jgi:hypothetical protein
VWIKQKLRRENLSYLPATLALRKAASGLPLNLMPFDVDRVVEDWREQQEP